MKNTKFLDPQDQNKRYNTKLRQWIAKTEKSWGGKCKIEGDIMNS